MTQGFWWVKLQISCMSNSPGLPLTKGSQIQADVAEGTCRYWATIGPWPGEDCQVLTALSSRDLHLFPQIRAVRVLQVLLGYKKQFILLRISVVALSWQHMLICKRVQSEARVWQCFEAVELLGGRPITDEMNRNMCFWFHFPNFCSRHP